MWIRPLALACMFVAASCATTGRPAIRQGDDELSLQVQAWEELGASVGRGFGSSRMEAIDGARCTLANDKGTWVASAPGRIRVARSAAPLEVECVKPGFKAQRLSLRCLTPRERSEMAESTAAALYVLVAPLALLNPITAVQWGAHAGALAASAALDRANPGSSRDLCSYGSVFMYLARE